MFALLGSFFGGILNEMAPIIELHTHTVNSGNRYLHPQRKDNSCINYIQFWSTAIHLFIHLFRLGVKSEYQIVCFKCLKWRVTLQKCYYLLLSKMKVCAIKHLYIQTMNRDCGLLFLFFLEIPKIKQKGRIESLAMFCEFPRSTANISKPR